MTLTIPAEITASSSIPVLLLHCRFVQSNAPWSFLNNHAELNFFKYMDSAELSKLRQLTIDCVIVRDRQGHSRILDSFENQLTFSSPT
ncbi:hypothetical protein BIW11_06292 [Tropilaelaps mercedesae]|uniref:Uncharacterized protein n=1 Tax=Tropilaelaps mercedesae TaxID=418985 RepID=A0A1V9XYU9_9ACAR|nr:hypothetical protein BIW11_06292 [Tropilaelaps mercedesae]